MRILITLSLLTLGCNSGSHVEEIIAHNDTGFEVLLLEGEQNLEALFESRHVVDDPTYQQISKSLVSIQRYIQSSGVEMEIFQQGDGRILLLSSSLNVMTNPDSGRNLVYLHLGSPVLINTDLEDLDVLDLIARHFYSVRIENTEIPLSLEDFIVGIHREYLSEVVNLEVSN